MAKFQHRRCYKFRDMTLIACEELAQWCLITRRRFVELYDVRWNCNLLAEDAYLSKPWVGKRQRRKIDGLLERNWVFFLDRETPIPWHHSSWDNRRRTYCRPWEEPTWLEPRVLIDCLAEKWCCECWNGIRDDKMMVVVKWIESKRISRGLRLIAISAVCTYYGWGCSLLQINASRCDGISSGMHRMV